MAERRRQTTRRIGRFLVKSVPGLLKSLASIGTAAMLWVGGGILLHGLEELHVADFIPHAVHELAHSAGAAAGPLEGLVAWLVTALGGAVLGFVVGGVIAAAARRLTKHPEELIVD
jgi:predicted DNA repair protein MutK